MQGITYSQVSSWSKISVRTLEKQFHKLFNQSPPNIIIPELTTNQSYLLIDGLWFGKRYCLMLYRHSRRKIIIYSSVMSREYGSLIAKDLKMLKTRYHFTGIVSDGGTGIKNAVFTQLGHIPHQICLAHIHRQIVNSMGRHPKNDEVKNLKLLSDHLWLIESKEALLWWKNKLNRWFVKNKPYLMEYRTDIDGHWWYIHSGVRKAVRMLISAPDYCFKFLDHPLIPKTTNELEGSISVLSRKHNIHKGLRRTRVTSFIKWFIYFYNRKLLSQSNIK